MPNQVRSIVVGTAGHIDHGKSALVKALTGTDPDRLKEEKARGITIDLGFAHAEIGGLTMAFVDVPGHERFVKNMLAGAGGIGRADEELVIVPSNRRVKIRGMQVHGEPRDVAQAGRGVAVNLGGVDVADLSRGETLTRPGALETTRRFDAVIDLLPDAPPL